MDRVEFLKLLAEKIYPGLRKQGFKGSGASLRRSDGVFHHIFNVQGSTASDGCYFNLGAHLEFLPTAAEAEFDAARFNEPSCCFRTRLDSPAGEKWRYPGSKLDTTLLLEAFDAAWQSEGREFYSQFVAARETECLDQLVLRLATVDSHSADWLTAARISAHLGRFKDALRLAQSGVVMVPAYANGLRMSFDALIQATEAKLSGVCQDS